MSESPTRGTATEFILFHATEEDLKRIEDAIRNRRAGLAAVRSAAVSVGMRVRLGGFKPKYFNDLEGVVARIEGSLASVRLDEDSTNQLRYHAVRRLTIPADQTHYQLGGVPLTCCHVVE